MRTTVYTVGHSTRTIEDFVTLLHTFNIEIVVDVRTIARSRHNPQYNEQELAESLRLDDIVYVRMKGLGGLRHTTKASINGAWNNPSFRGYADYMQTPEFAENLRQLLRVAEEGRTAIMCAEAVPCPCHRSLIGDALTVADQSVVDIIAQGSGRAHQLTPFAQVNGETITYPVTQTR